MKTIWYMLALSLSVTLHASLLFVGDPTQSATLPMNQGHATLQLNLVASIATPPSPEPPAVLKTPVDVTPLKAPAPPIIRHEPEALPEPAAEPVLMTAPVIEHAVATLPVMQDIVEHPAPPQVTLTVADTSPITQQAIPVATPTSASVDANADPQPQGVTTQAQLHDPIRPVYPLLSRRRGEEGTVTIEVRVTSKGQADSVTITQTSGFPRLDKAALKACRQARYLPAMYNGQCIDASFNFKVRFQLQKPL